MSQSTWREQTVVLNQNDITEIYFSDTKPNHIIFNNNTENPLYVGTSANVSPNYYDMMVPVGATQIFARPNGMANIFVWNAAIVKKGIKIQSFIDDFTQGSITQTQTVINQQQLTGEIDVISLPELPTGNNRIGSVQAELSGDLVSSSGLKVDLQGAGIAISQALIGDMSAKTTEISFQSEQSLPGDGNQFIVEAYKNLTIEIVGDSTSRQISFIGVTQQGYQIPIMGVNMSTYNYDIKTIGNNEIWSFDITGFYSIIMKIDSVSGGNVTIKGKAVA